MDLERWKRVRELSEALAALPPEAREAGLAEVDAALRDAVRALLAEDDDDAATRAGQPDAAALAAALVEDPARRIGQRLGSWRLASVLGEGGMGTVYLAERVEGGFTQRAALKLVRPALAAGEVLARFRYERQILAGLEHPNIARLIDGGAGPGGEPFLALEYVEGEPLREHCDARRLSTEARIAMFLTVCDAVAYANERLVVHRDLKPGNVLVTPRGEVKLLDFGIAKLIDSERPSEATALGQRAFTPEYAAPEQILGEPASVAVDVYALGVMLFELLTGQRPYRIQGNSAAQVEQAVLGAQVQRPSSVVTRRPAADSDLPERIAEARATRPQALRRLLRGDLDAIVLKALRREPQDRYASVRQLAEDLRAHLARRPVAARRGDRRYRSLRFVQRHLLALSLASLALLSLLVGLGVALWQADVARAERVLAQQERDAARRQALTAEKTLDFMKSVFQLADPSESLGQTVTAADLLAKGARDIETQLGDEPAIRIALIHALAEAYLGLAQPQAARDLLESARSQAEGVGDPLLLGETLLLLGASLTKLGDDRGDEALMREALHLPLPASAAGEILRGQIELRLAIRVADRSAYDEARQLYEQGFARVRAAGGGLAHEYVIPYTSLLHAIGEKTRAETLLQEALADARETLPPLHPSRAGLLAQLSTNYMRQGRLAEAEPLLREALALKRQVYGEDHPSPDLTAHNLAQNLADQGRWREAEAIARDVLARSLQRHGPDHPRTAATQSALAKALLGQDRAAESEPYWRAALVTARAAFGAQDNATAISSLGLGRALMAQARWDEAAEALDETVRVYTALLPHAAGGLARARLERLRLALARGEKAECGSARESLAHYESIGQPMGIGYAKAVLGECLRRSGGRDEADALIAASIAQLRQTPGEHWPETRYALALDTAR